MGMHSRSNSSACKGRELGIQSSRRAAKDAHIAQTPYVIEDDVFHRIERHLPQMNETAQRQHRSATIIDFEYVDSFEQMERAPRIDNDDELG